MRRDSFDVAIVGAGSAGIAAGLAAAHAGARALLVERSDVLGGNAAQAFVHTICGLYHAADDAPPRYANPGIPRQLAEFLQRVGAAAAPERVGRVHVLPTDPVRFAVALAERCRRSAGLRVWTRCALVDAELSRERGAPSRLRLAHEIEGEREVSAALVVDASGDANLAAQGGAAVSQAPAESLQVPSYIFRLEGVDTREIEGFARLRLTHAVAGAVRAGRLPAGCESVLVRRGGQPGEVYVTLNVPRPPEARYEPLDAACLARLEAGAREHASGVADFLRETRPAFEKSRVGAWPRRIGIRETRRVSGLAEVRREDVLAGRWRDDEVALSTWPIELWKDHRRAHLEYPERPCSIPLGALASRTHPRLAAAGRCLSASHAALGALRVIGTALATGQAAGVAAALAADAGSDLGAVAAERVRDHLLALDADDAGWT